MGDLLGRPYLVAQGYAAEDNEVVVWCPWEDMQIFLSTPIPCTYYQNTSIDSEKEDLGGSEKDDNTWIYILCAISVVIILLICAVSYCIYSRKYKNNNYNNVDISDVSDVQMTEAQN